MTKEKQPVRLQPRPISTISQAVVLPDKPTWEPDFFLKLDRNERLEVSKGTLLVVQDQEKLAELLFFEDETITGPLVYREHGSADIDAEARKSIESDVHAYFFMSGTCTLFLLIVSVLSLTLSTPDFFNMFVILLAVASLGCLGFGFFEMVSCKRDVVSTLRRNYRSGRLTVRLPRSMQSVE